MDSGLDYLTRKAMETLLRKPLCDRCLGRLFASFGLGLSNAERGRALKILILMDLHRRVSEGDESSLSQLKIIAENGGPLFSELASKYIGTIKPRKCVICNG